MEVKSSTFDLEVAGDVLPVASDSFFGVTEVGVVLIPELMFCLEAFLVPDRSMLRNLDFCADMVVGMKEAGARGNAQA